MIRHSHPPVFPLNPFPPSYAPPVLGAPYGTERSYRHKQPVGKPMGCCYMPCARCTLRSGAGGRTSHTAPSKMQSNLAESVKLMGLHDRTLLQEPKHNMSVCQSKRQDEQDRRRKDRMIFSKKFLQIAKFRIADISIAGDGISNSVKIAVKYIFPRWWDRLRAMSEFVRYEMQDFYCDGLHIMMTSHIYDRDKYNAIIAYFVVCPNNGNIVYSDKERLISGRDVEML